MIIGILVTAMADHLFGLSTATPAALAVRLAVKLLLLPLIAGISYEILKLLAINDTIVLRILRSPGMLLQKLSTRQPDLSMLEVSITSFKNVLYMDGLMEEPPQPAAEGSEEAAPVQEKDIRETSPQQQKATSAEAL